MNEVRKSAVRRARDPVFVQTYFRGAGIDIGSERDPLSSYTWMFPHIRDVITWNREQGDPLHMRGIEDGTYDFVHSSFELAFVDNPGQALARWLEITKPGGYVIVTVPDEDLYGKGQWPNRFNKDHKSSFTIYKPTTGLPRSISVLDVVSRLSRVAQCERISLVRENFDKSRTGDDQTRTAAECSIEIVLRKLEVPKAQTLLREGWNARNGVESVERLRTALKMYPYRFDSYHVLMLALLRVGQVHEIEALWNECVEFLPNESSPHMYRALNTIALGKLKEGFTQRENVMRHANWRVRTKAQPPERIACWRGESLEGKSIVIWSEFGLGDEIFFLRLAKILRDKCSASRVSVVCQTPLVELFEASGQADHVIDIAAISTLEEHDFWVYPHAIPAYVQLDYEHLPQSVPYLKAKKRAVLPSRDESRAALKVGLVFKGAPTHENDKARSIPTLGTLDELFGLPNVEFYSLQKGEGIDQTAQYAQHLPNFRDLGPTLNSLSDTACAIEALDLLISVDTSVAHLAAAMGKPTWVLLPGFGDWRWHYQREDSPWYPTARLFRCPLSGGWTDVVSQVREALAERIEAACPETTTM